MLGMAVRPLQAAVAGTLAVDNNKSACCALGGAAQAPRAVDILTLSKVLASTTSSQGVRIRTRHTAHALPDKFDVVCSDTSTSSAAAILHHGPAWVSLAAFLDKLSESMLPEACRPRIRGWARLQQQGCRDFASMRQTGSADRRRQIELMHLLVRTFVCVQLALCERGAVLKLEYGFNTVCAEG